MTALCFVPEEDGYIITGSGVFLRGEKLRVEELRASDTANRIIGVRCCHIASYLYLVSTPAHVCVLDMFMRTCANARRCVCIGVCALLCRQSVTQWHHLPGS